MPMCKNCGSEQAVKNGIVSGKQRYRCRECGYNFRVGDNRTNDRIAAQKAMCILLYAMAKGSFRMMGRIFKKNHALIYRWIRAFGETLPEPKVSGEIKEIEFDELWHFIRVKKTNFLMWPPVKSPQPNLFAFRRRIGSGREWTVNGSSEDAVYPASTSIFCFS